MKEVYENDKMGLFINAPKNVLLGAHQKTLS